MRPDRRRPLSFDGAGIVVLGVIAAIAGFLFAGVLSLLK